MICDDLDSVESNFRMFFLLALVSRFYVIAYDK